MEEEKSCSTMVSRTKSTWRMDEEETCPTKPSRGMDDERIIINTNTMSESSWWMESERSSSVAPSGKESSSVLEGEESSTTTSSSDATWRMEGEEIASLPICHNQRNTHKKSFIDDLTLLERISLKDLVQKERIIGPLNFHDRFNLFLPPQKSILQHQLEDLKDFTTQHHMVINSKKTKCLPFNSSLTKDFLPQFQLEEGVYLDVIYQLSWFSYNQWFMLDMF